MRPTSFCARARPDVIGGDVVCLMPTKDLPNNITAMVAAHMMYEIVSLVAETLRT